MVPFRAKKQPQQYAVVVKIACAVFMPYALDRSL